MTVGATRRRVNSAVGRASRYHHLLISMSTEPKRVVIYTDGACEPNPGGPGGYGVVLIYGVARKEMSGGFRSTTNNRMEIHAAIIGLEALTTPCEVTLHSDSEYLVNAMTQGWVKRWQENSWWRNKKEKAVNADLWEKMLALCDKHRVDFVWVKGHAGEHENERCDQLSYAALRKPNLPADEGYEQRPETAPSGKVTNEGQPCRKCNTPVIKKTPHQNIKRDQSYYFEYYLYCPNCHTMYMVEEAKRHLEKPRLF